MFYWSRSFSSQRLLLSRKYQDNCCQQFILLSLSPLSIYPSFLGSLPELTPGPRSRSFLWSPFDNNVLSMTSSPSSSLSSCCCDPRVGSDGFLRHGVPPVEVGSARGFLQGVLQVVTAWKCSRWLSSPVIDLVELRDVLKFWAILQIFQTQTAK